MTKQELIEMVGSVEQADYVIEIILKNLQPAFIESAVKVELKEIESKIQKLKNEGFITTSNGYNSVNWAKAEKLNGLNLSEKQQTEYDTAWEKCAKSSDLLYMKNRTVSLLAVR